MPERKVTADTWLKALGDNGITHNAKGFCDDFKSVGHATKFLLEATESAGEGKVEMHVMEPLSGNAAPLQATIDANGLTDLVTVYQMAASDQAGEAQMPTGDIGVESHGLGTPAKSGAMETVRVVTLDGWAKEAGIFDRRIDILFIDVEGYDALVIDGGAQLLGSAWDTGRGARWLVFEYHSVGMWPKRSLKDVVAKLDTWGYDCYFAGNRDPLTRLTGCWDDVFEIRHLSNIVCANRNDPIARTVALSIDAMNNSD
jgi:FkbM family methyltransferase